MTLQVGPQKSELRSMELLEGIDEPESRRKIEAILADETAPSRLRVQAARSLSRLRQKEALIRHIGIADEAVRASVLLSLGKVGDAEALRVIEQALVGAEGRVLAHGRFAAALIAHRLRIAGHDLPPPSDEVLEPPAGSLRPFEIRRAQEATVDLVLRLLTREPFGITYSRSHALEIRCEKRRWMILLNEDLVTPDGINSLREKKAFVGVVASRQQAHRIAHKTYSVRYVMLFSPPSEKNRHPLVLYGPTGKAAFAGTAAVADGHVDFRLRALRNPGALPIRLDGTFTPGELRASEAGAATATVLRREPSPG